MVDSALLVENQVYKLEKAFKFEFFEIENFLWLAKVFF